MKNDYLIGNSKISIPPTVLFSVMGKINNARKAVTMDAKRPAGLVYVLGEILNELGGPGQEGEEFIQKVRKRGNSD